MTQNLQLENRSFLEISGLERKKFLQGLITNDVNKATKENLIYAAMLNAQGRFLYDFFIFELAEKLILDCAQDRRDEIFTKLNFYKLRSKVEIKKNDELAVFWNLENKNSQDLYQKTNLLSDSTKDFGDKIDEKTKLYSHTAEAFSPILAQKAKLNRKQQNSSRDLFFGIEFADPRNPKMGFRFYTDNKPSQNENIELYNTLTPALSPQGRGSYSEYEYYHFKRISLKIPEGENDLTYEKSFILEFGFDDLNAVDYQKGCYVGQEPTARIHHLGQIRKKIFHIEIDLSPEAAETLPKGSEITCEEKSAGIVLSSIFHEKKLHALALIKIPEDQNSEGWQKELKLGQNKILII